VPLDHFIFRIKNGVVKLGTVHKSTMLNKALTFLSCVKFAKKMSYDVTLLGCFRWFLMLKKLGRRRRQARQTKGLVCFARRLSLL